MKGIGGNKQMQIQISTTTKNAIGEQVKSWKTAQIITGFLDLQGGDSKYQTFNAKIQESTHIFIADYVQLAEGIEALRYRLHAGPGDIHPRLPAGGRRAALVVPVCRRQLCGQWLVLAPGNGAKDVGMVSV